MIETRRPVSRELMRAAEEWWTHEHHGDFWGAIVRRMRGQRSEIRISIIVTATETFIITKSPKCCVYHDRLLPVGGAK